jgi:hypothetical protein
MAHDAVLGTTTKRETQILVGDGHVVRTYPFATALTGVLLAGALVALTAGRELYPYGVTQDTDLGQGDGAEKTFTGSLGGLVQAGSVTVTDGTESFADDGFGVLTGDAGGTGKVNYLTGDVSVTCNAAPENGAAVSASCTHWCRGCLVRDAEIGAVDGEVVTSGGVNAAELTMPNGDPATAAALAEMEFIGPWPA